MFNLSGFGNLVREVEVKNFGDNNICRFSLASNQRVKKGKEYVYEPTYLDVEYWTKSTEFVEAMKVGKKYYVYGELVQEHWEKEGEKKSKFVMKASGVQFLEPKSDDSGKTEDMPKSRKSQNDNDDVPF